MNWMGVEKRRSLGGREIALVVALVPVVFLFVAAGMAPQSALGHVVPAVWAWICRPVVLGVGAGVALLLYLDWRITQVLRLLFDIRAGRR